jgi:hypothetical protein
MKFFHVFQLLVACALFQLCTLNHATAQNSPALNIQGVLRNSNETAVENGIYKIKFSLYTVETGGVAVWSETQDSVVVNGGVYSTALGKKTPMNAAFDQVYYLGVKVGSGQEMTPRALLSSAPYALSLIGQSNTFPSSGGIGAGTNTPAAGYQLHAYKDEGSGKILLEGSTAALLDFKKGSTTGSLGFGTSNNNFIVNPGANNLALQYNGSTKLTVNDQGVSVTGAFSAPNFSPQDLGVAGYVAVGDNNPANNGGNRLVVRGSTYLDGFTYVSGAGAQSWNPGVANFLNGAPNPFVQFFPGNANLSFGFNVNSNMRANEIYLSSDRRIKTDFSRSEGSADLDVLRKLEVTNYRHIDTLEHGKKLKKGLIAQEVKKVMENAVTISSDFIPNIFTVSKGIQFTNGKLTVALDKNHGLEVGDVVKLYTEKEEMVKVSAVPSKNSFVVEWTSPAPKDEKIFVYGKAVRDFHAVDYDQIFTLNVSATQELARQVEQLKKENEALKAQIGQCNVTLKAADEKFESRLRMLESKLNN